MGSVCTPSSQVGGSSSLPGSRPSPCPRTACTDPLRAQQVQAHCLLPLCPDPGRPQPGRAATGHFRQAVGSTVVGVQ
eukprot:2216893-Rhodomonas_salina.1